VAKVANWMISWMARNGATDGIGGVLMSLPPSDSGRGMKMACSVFGG